MCLFRGDPEIGANRGEHRGESRHRTGARAQKKPDVQNNLEEIMRRRRQVEPAAAGDSVVRRGIRTRDTFVRAPTLNHLTTTTTTTSHRIFSETREPRVTRVLVGVADCEEQQTGQDERGARI